MVRCAVVVGLFDIKRLVLVRSVVVVGDEDDWVAGLSF